MRTKEELITLIGQGEEIDYVFFWGPSQKYAKLDPRSFLSQWYLSDMKIGGLVYNCCEQWMMAEKARLFRDLFALDQILKAEHPSKQRMWGGKVKNFDPEIWDKRCNEIVVKGNLAKITQNEELKKYLLSTGDLVIVKASPYDLIWGIGLKENHSNARVPSLWLGENRLGFALEKVRSIIRERESRNG